MSKRIATEINQQRGENYADWKWRIILGKAKGDIKITWTEVKELLGLTYSEEYLRKLGYGCLSYENYLQEKRKQLKGDDMEQVIDTLELKRIDLQKMKMQMQDQKRELTKLIREWSRAEHIKNEIMEAVKEVAEHCTNEFEIPQTEEKKSGKEGALLLSDWHVGMRTKNVVNTYNDKVLRERIEKLILQTIEYGEQNNIEVLHIFALGDLINGLIHVTTRINNEENIIEQTKIVCDMLQGMLISFMSKFPKIKIYFSRGNHDRVTPNMKESLSAESFLDIIPWFLEAQFSGIENIEFIDNEYDDEIIVAEIKGSKIFAVHGHRDKPAKAVGNLTMTLKMFPDYIFMGHYHSSASLEEHGAEVIVNSSLCGTDDYAMSLRRSAKPAQKFLIFDERGKICTYDILLDK